MTECTQQSFEFQPLRRREITAKFDAPAITSDAGGLLLRELDSKFGFIKHFGGCFRDLRDSRYTTHSLEELLAQRIFGIALGYEDLNDHEQLRYDPLMAVLAGKNDPDPVEGFALAGKSTLNRLELTAVRPSRYKKIVADHHKVKDFFVDAFLQIESPQERIVIDLDATDDPLHGHQLGRFFHGYYKCYCYLPLYIFCGSHLLSAKLRPSNIDGAAGSVKELTRIVAQIRVQWPDVKIVIRGDGGFCREHIMHWCESNDVDYVLGLPKNERLKRAIGKELHEAKQQFEETQEASRVYRDFHYRTEKSWSRERRVIGKAEHLAKGENPRFVVTSLNAESFDAVNIYEEQYCGRGDMENRIKEQQLYLFADRTSASTMRANQLRLWFSSVAYVLLNALRELGLKDTKLEKAQCSTIRTKLLKVGAAIRVTVRRVWVSMSGSYPFMEIFRSVFENVQSLPVDRLTPD